eukprot:TRINITY_DN9523_c0_g1_i1.p1 TRINITY_DN9523_c0_g1~~TRINITY_DN9523_c0_g1_i1.p1  ORF type:complete len:362 (+),score=74.09 TRINITY_DN9523_c0_g1_i1:33-1118(+)
MSRFSSFLKDLLAYNTFKVVQIRDWRLGVLQYLFILGVFLYTIVYQIILKQQYLFLERPVGSIRLSLQQPQQPTAPELLQYCQLGNNLSYINGFDTYPCAYLDEFFVVFPETEATAMLATTRYTVSNQVLYCDVTDPSCEYTETSNATYYIGDIENFTLMVDHTAFSPGTGIQANSKNLPGQMVNYDGKQYELQAPDVIGQPGHPDIIRLGTLLKAAGVNSLDDQSQYSGDQTNRFYGTVIVVLIEYSNTKSYNTSDIQYQYQPVVIQGTEFKAVQPIFTKNITSRVLWNRHGVRMIFVQAGMLGKFDFQIMLIAFVSGMGLVTAATVVVDVIATRLMPEKKYYKAYKYKPTAEYKKTWYH